MGDLFPVAYLETQIDGRMQRFPLTETGVCRIGRSEKNDIVLSDDLTSRSHALLQRSGDGSFYISDLASSNGTLVNGARISRPVLLRDGYHINIGGYQFTFVQESLRPTPPSEEIKDVGSSTTISFKNRLITVLVADIRNFTGLAQRLEPDKLSRLTATFFREGGKALSDRGAWEQKYIGDAIMAIWQHKRFEPEPHELLAVFEAICILTGIVSGLHYQFGLEAPIRIGVGVNTGLASVANLGTTAGSDYTALGDVVTMAFRLESASKQLGCDFVLGEGTYSFLAGQAERIFERCAVNIKGYDDPVTAYRAQLTSLSAVLEGLL